MMQLYVNRYYDPLYFGFGALRIINEDYIDPMQGFGEHPHSEMEIFSYIVSGELEHRDSMGNVEIAKRGDVQVCLALGIQPHYSHTSR